MAFFTDELYEDTAQIRHNSLASFGSGRLVAKNLILTARHVVTDPVMNLPVDSGWEVRLLAERKNDLQEPWTWRDAKVVWRGQNQLDLALLALEPAKDQIDSLPRLSLRIAQIDQVRHHPVVALGFPRGSKEEGKRALFAPTGTLDDEKGLTLAFGVDQAYQPQMPNEDWRGFSGGAVLLADNLEPASIWIYGVAQQVPANFTHRLAVSRLASAWQDQKFCDLLRNSETAFEEPSDPLHPGWTQFTEACRRANETQLDQLSGTRRYDHSLYVGRSSLEEVLHAFLKSEKMILPLIGQTGTGKTFFMANIAAARLTPVPTLLLLAYKLAPAQAGIASSILAAVSSALPRFSVFGNEFSLNTLTGRAGELIILLDGLNETPSSVEVLGRWFEASWDWLKSQRVRLIVTSRPEYWNLIEPWIPRASVYREYAVPVDIKSLERDSRQAALVQVRDFSESEAAAAAKRYEFEFGSSSDPAFRHPLLLHIYKEGKSASPAQSVFDLFRNYFKASFDRIRRTSSTAVPDGFVWSAMRKVAAAMRSQSTLWIDFDRYFEAFGPATSVANGFVAEHLLIEGESGFRFVFDELAYFLIASLTGTGPEHQLVVDYQLDIIDRDPLLWNSIPLILCKFENEGRHNAVNEVLFAIAGSEHGELDDRYFEAHRIFLRSAQWLRNPPVFYEAINSFAKHCASKSDAYLEEVHPLLALCDLPGLNPDQRCELLRIVASRELDAGWRWKDWENLSEQEFWHDRYATSFKLFIQRELERDAAPLIETLLKLLQDMTPLKRDDEHPEAKIRDLASAFLFFSPAQWTNSITDFLVADFETGCHARLLHLFAGKKTLQILPVLERWEELHDVERDRRIVSCAFRMEAEALSDDVKERVACLLERILDRSRSSDLTSETLKALSRVPSRREFVIEKAEKLAADPSSTIDPEMFLLLRDSDPARAFRLLTTMIESAEVSGRREAAIDALSSLVIPERPAQVLKYLISHSSVSSGGGHALGLAIERALNRAMAIPSYDDEVFELFSRAWDSLNAAARRQIIFSVASVVPERDVNTRMLHVIAETETDDGNLQLLLRRIAPMNIPFEEAFQLLQQVANQQKTYPPGIALLIGAQKNSTFARRLASLDDHWSGPMKVLADFRDQIRSGREMSRAFWDVFKEYRSG